MHIIDGKKISHSLLLELRKTIVDKNITPGLAIVLVGNDPASHLYVEKKEEAAKKIGMDFNRYLSVETTPEKEIIDCIQFLNKDPDIHGIIVQLPLPGNLNTDTIIKAIDPQKDADGFHPDNLSCLLANKHCPPPVTAASALECLKASGEPLSNKKVAVVSKSNILYTPLQYLLKKEGAESEHFTELDTKIKEYDHVIIALGQPKCLTKQYIKEGAVVVDIGIHRLTGDEDSIEIVGDV
ncbi:MAG: bifunctional 5,10-methylenetetrahydrofolate dehydrogenase/5,10-methenyltetrahydrofolate cyclohydrolase, partial [Candidatus Jacksonbacteria bacterium]|nr:bifunctional 5,10-methylenetetrahydrofolate dehydrogenase/5,10-methenyltetrahydrofolate cyclohydrolase [Candidatus Jacksonbacteria bacterium]